MYKTLLILIIILFIWPNFLFSSNYDYIIENKTIYSNHVRSFVVSTNNDVYFIGSEGNIIEGFLFSYIDGKVNKISRILDDYSIDKIVLIDSNNHIWFTSYKNDIDVIIYDFNNFTEINFGINDLKIKDISLFNNKVYLATNNGLLEYDYNELIIYSQEDIGSTSNNFLNINISDNNLFFHDFFNAYVYDGINFNKISLELKGANALFHNNNIWLYHPTFIDGVNKYSLNKNSLIKFEDVDIFNTVNAGQCIDNICWFSNHSHTELMFYTNNNWGERISLNFQQGFVDFKFVSHDVAYFLSNMNLYKKKFNLNNNIITPPKNILSKTIITNQTMYNNLKGRILLQVESAGEAYYIHPNKTEKYFLGRPDDAFSVMREQGIGITNSDLAKIPVSLDYLSGPDTSGDGLPDDFKIALGLDVNSTDSDGDGYCDFTELLHGYDPLGPGRLNHDLNFAQSQAGRILLQVEQNGEAWYVSPENNKLYFLGRPADAFSIMRNLGLGISNENLERMVK